MERTKLVEDLVQKVVTCKLQYPPDLPVFADERDYLWRPKQEPCYTGKEDYANDIRRLLFEPNMDFRLDENHQCISEKTRAQYYEYQCTNQMHICMDTCWKYNYGTDNTKKCRFHYPVPMERANNNTSTIYTLCDRKKRKQTKINAPRNNGWLNPLPTHPLVVFGNQGNMDIQYISNASGAVEYTTGYIGKPDQPDHQVLINMFSKKLAQAVLHNENRDATQRQQLNAAGNALAASEQVGAVQCAYTLLDLPFVKLSRKVYTISPAPTSVLTKNIVTDVRQLQHMNPGDSTVSTSTRSHSGRRLAYHKLCQYQYSTYGVCNVSLYTILSCYAITKPQRIRKDGSAAATYAPKLLECTELGMQCNYSNFLY